LSVTCAQVVVKLCLSPICETTRQGQFRVDTELLRTFLEVRSTRHFGKAAENLCITQAAVSARIKQLEETLGATLFLRTRNNIQLSSEGERLVPHAETMLLALARARQEVALGGSDSRQLLIGVREGIWCDALQQKLHRLLASEPDLVLNVLSLEAGEIMQKLLAGALDIAVLYAPPSVPELEIIAIGALTLRLYSSGKRSNARLTAAQNYVYLDWGGGFSRFHARHFGDHAPPALRTNLKEVATRYLAVHGGACYLPASQRLALADTGLAPVRGAPVFSQPLNIVYHSASPQRELIEAVVQHFADVKA